MELLAQVTRRMPELRGDLRGLQLLLRRRLRRHRAHRAHALAHRAHRVDGRRGLHPAHAERQIQGGHVVAGAEGDERVGEEARRGVAMVRLAGESLLEHRHQPLGEPAVDLVQRVDAAIADRQQHRQLPASRKKRLAEEHLGQHRRHREEVRPVIEGLAGHLLGREVGELPLEDRARLVAQGLPRRRPRDAEVPELHPSFLRQVQVRRGDVAVNDPERRSAGVRRRVHALERLQHLVGDVHRDAERQQLVLLAKPPQEPVAVDPVDELHCQVGLAVGAHPRAEHLDDVGVLHAGMQPRLALEHRPTFGVGGEVGQEPLDHHLARLRGRIDGVRQVHLRRAADRDPRIELVRPEAGAAARQVRRGFRAFAGHRTRGAA